MNKIECFNVRIYKTKSLNHIDNYQVIKTILCNKHAIAREPISIVADPFLFVKDDRLFLFYENKTVFHNGYIMMTSTNDLISWTNPIIVLEETCHLSYPWVFEENGQVYMIPETSGLKEIRLYKANHSLTDFKFVKTILKDEVNRLNGFSFSDTSIIKKDHMYYLLTTVNDNGANILKLYFSEHFDFGYTEHSASPIFVGNKYGRNAGCLYKYNDKLYRFAQDCVKRYGDNVHVLEVIKIDKYHYEEKTIKDYVLTKNVPFYKEGGHQINIVQFRGEYIIATDAKQYKWFLINRILHHFGFIANTVSRKLNENFIFNKK